MELGNSRDRLKILRKIVEILGFRFPDYLLEKAIKEQVRLSLQERRLPAF
jgi:hypothetical protein